MHIFYMETRKVPPCNQNNDTPIHEAVRIWYTALNFEFLPIWNMLVVRTYFLQWKHCQELCLKIKLILEYVNFSFPNMMKRIISTKLSICITIIGEYCFREKKPPSSWNLFYTSEKFKANTRSASSPTAQIACSKHTIGKNMFSEHNSLDWWHCDQKCIFFSRMLPV